MEDIEYQMVAYLFSPSIDLEARVVISSSVTLLSPSIDLEARVVISSSVTLPEVQADWLPKLIANLELLRSSADDWRPMTSDEIKDYKVRNAEE